MAGDKMGMSYRPRHGHVTIAPFGLCFGTDKDRNCHIGRFIAEPRALFPTADLWIIAFSPTGVWITQGECPRFVASSPGE
jgi:hypothetical protein